MDAIDRIHIAKPCPANWEEMKGDERVRHCSLCSRNVYNLSSLSRAEVNALLADREQRVCMRLYRRADGKVMTADCPKPIGQAARRFVLFGTTAVVSLLAWTVAIAQVRPLDAARSSILDAQPFKTIMSWAGGTPPAHTSGRLGRVILGGLAVPAPKPKP